MKIQNKFQEWCKENYLSINVIEDSIFECNDQKFLLLQGDREDIFNSDFELIVLPIEQQKLSSVNYVVYLFGTKFYYTKISELKNPILRVFKYIGKTVQTTPGLPFLGIHGEYEILNGSRTYSDWVEKAKFLDISILGICEKNTLAGTLPLQKECVKSGIKSIIGETISIKSEQAESFYEGKVYVINQKGWENILLINTEINVINPTQFINEDRLLELSEGLVFIFSPVTFPYNSNLIKKYQLSFTHCYFQLDTVQYVSNTTDMNYLQNTQDYLNNELKLSPILLCDAYCLDEDGVEVRKKLNKIGSKSSLSSLNQYFKSDDENLILFDKLFQEQDFEGVLNKSIESLSSVAELCNFQITTGVFKLPKYIMNPEESAQFKTSEDLFYYLIEKGFNEKCSILKNQEEYLDRIDKEIAVIQKGGFIEYFLILWDIVEWCGKNNILTGLGRGSAAGSLIAYLLNITKIDPLPYNLLFERFLNEGRIGKSLPDIDTDFESNRKMDVKRFMEDKYGYDRVCSVGTYSTLQLKAAFRDFCKLENVPEATMAYISKLFFDTDEGVLRPDWEYFFQQAVKFPMLMEFIQKYPLMIEQIQLCRSQPRAASVHACATIILPENESIFTSIPIRQGEVNNMKIFVSEWEGEYLEYAGYLKEDILGISQLDKFRMILNLVKENYDEEVDIYKIPLNEVEVYKMFSKGQNGDVFHLGSRGLTAYCTQVHPETINDLTAMLALYRPGPIQNNFHSEYVLLRHGDKAPEYLEGTENITKDTYGLFIYQEQIMQVCQEVAGFSLIEADDIRKAMGKLDKPLLASYETRFKEGGTKRNYSEDYLNDLWEKLLRFGGYSFNKSHSLCYAVTGYYCQYLKYKYPLPYWITALEYGNDTDILRYISEIYQSKMIKILPPDINKSQLKFIADFKTKEIVWSIGKVKECGEVRIEAIFNERDRNGEFFSLQEFLSRVDKTKVNKTVVENLILTGAFDSIENIKFPCQRKLLINEYREYLQTKVDKEKDWFSLALRDNKIDYDWWWLLQQKKVSGLAFFNYEDLIVDYNTLNYQSLDTFLFKNISDQESVIISVAGVVSEVNISSSKRGEYCKIRLEQNYSFVWVTVWSDFYPTYQEVLETAKGKIAIITARGYYDSYKQENALQSDEKFTLNLLG